MSIKQIARRELFRITDEELNPGWYNDPQLVKERDRLMVILGMSLDPIREEGESKEAYRQRACQYFFDVRPGLEEHVVKCLRAGKKIKQISEENDIPTMKMNYLREKYQFLSKKPKK